MRRAFLFLIILLLVSGGVWYFFLRNKSVVPNTDGTGSFFPTPQPGVVPLDGSENTVNQNTEREPQINTGNPLYQVTSNPVAGYTIFSLQRSVVVPPADQSQKPTTQTLTDAVVRFVARSSGYVYESVNDDIALQISNINIPNVYEASFADGNKTALLRYLRTDDRTVATYAVPIPDENSDGTRTQRIGTLFPDNIESLVISPDSRTVGRLISTSTVGVLQTTTTSNTSAKEIIRSPFQEWLISWPTTKTMYLQTKAASSVEGYLYSLDTSAPKLRRVLGNITGLTASVSPKESYVLYSQSIENGFSTYLYNTKANTTTRYSLSFLPEKCAWLMNEDLICAGSTSIPNGTYPDSWYAGTMSFVDSLYYIYTKDGSYETLYDGISQAFDMTNLQIDEGRTMVYFIDKLTGSLWRYNY